MKIPARVLTVTLFLLIESLIATGADFKDVEFAHPGGVHDARIVEYAGGEDSRQRTRRDARDETRRVDDCRCADTRRRAALDVVDGSLVRVGYVNFAGLILAS